MNWLKKKWEQMLTAGVIMICGVAALSVIILGLIAVFWPLLAGLGAIKYLTS